MKRRVAHFGAIAFNYSIFGVCLIGVALLSTFFLFLASFLGIALIMFYYFALIIITIFTVGALLLAEEFRGLWAKGAEWISGLGNISEFASEKMLPFIADVLPTFTIVVLVTSIISFVCLLFDRKWEKAKSRLIFMGVSIVSLIILLIVIFAGIITIVGGAN